MAAPPPQQLPRRRLQGGNGIGPPPMSAPSLGQSYGQGPPGPPPIGPPPGVGHPQPPPPLPDRPIPAANNSSSSSSSSSSGMKSRLSSSRLSSSTSFPSMASMAAAPPPVQHHPFPAPHLPATSHDHHQHQHQHYQHQEQQHHQQQHLLHQQNQPPPHAVTSQQYPQSNRSFPLLSPLEWDMNGAKSFVRDTAAKIEGVVSGSGSSGGSSGSAADGKEIFRTAVIRTIMSVGAAVLFGIGTWAVLGKQAGTEFFAGYLVEQSLSVDNLFVFVMLFDYFAVPVEHQGRVLTWGIIGAVLMRGIMIAMGVAVVKSFRWCIVFFAGILLVSAWKLLTEEEGDHDLTHNTVVIMAKKMVGAVDRYDGDKFFTTVADLGKGRSRRVATPLLLCLVCIELSDFVFAVDSIPAVLGVTQEPFIVYSSNIFAILALRSIYTIIARAAQQLPYLKPAVAMVLGFVGVKMLLEFAGLEISTTVSLGVVVLLLTGGVVFSLMGSCYKARFKRKDSDSDLFGHIGSEGGLSSMPSTA